MTKIPDISELDGDAKAALCIQILRETTQVGGFGFGGSTLPDIRAAVIEFLREFDDIRLERVINWSEGAMGHYTYGTEHLEEPTIEAMGEALARNSRAEAGDIDETRWTFSLGSDEKEAMRAAYSATCAKRRLLVATHDRLAAAVATLTSRNIAHDRAVRELDKNRAELREFAVPS